MNRSLRVRPKLNLELAHILEAVRRHGQVVTAPRELGWSDGYVHVRLKRAGIIMAQVLESPGWEALLHGRG